MIRKGKLVKNAAIALAIISVFGSTLTPVSAAEIVQSVEESSVEYDAITAATTGSDSTTGGTTDSTEEYEELTCKFLKLADGSDLTNRMGFKSTKLKTVGNKKYIELKLANGNLFNSVKVQVNGGEEIEAQTSVEGDILTALFEINSLEDEVILSVSYSFSMGGQTMTHVHTGKLISELTTTEQELTCKFLKLADGSDLTNRMGFKSTKLKTVGNKKYIELKLANGNLFNSVKVQVNGGEEIEAQTSVEDDILTALFEINSLEDEVILSVSYSFSMGGQTMTHVHTGKLISELSSNDNTSDETTPDTDNGTTTPDTGNDSDTGSGTTTPDTGDELKDGNYTINITTPSSMGGQFLGDTADIKVENGKIYATFNMSGASLMSNIAATVDGKSVEFTEYEKNNDNVKFTVEVPDLDAKVVLSMYVDAMARNVEFEVSFDKETLKESTTNNGSTDSSNESNNNDSNNGSSENSGSSNDDTTSAEDTVVEGTIVKEYTIKNEVVYDNEIGYNMVRQYLNETTKIEKIDGKMYATLTFTGVDLMQNHKVYVNGSEVNHTITSKTSDSISIRFEISDINDDIQVQLFVVPMNKTVKFGVKLLEDTLTFVKEYTLETSEENTTGNETLPQTGSAFGSEMLLGFGGLLTASGVLLRRKRK